MPTHLICCINHSDVIPFRRKHPPGPYQARPCPERSLGECQGKAPCWWDGLYSPTPFSPGGRHSGCSRPVFRDGELCWLDNGLRRSPSAPSACPPARTPSCPLYEIPITLTGLVARQRSTLSRYSSILWVENGLDGTPIVPHRCPPCGHNNPWGDSKAPCFRLHSRALRSRKSMEAL